MRTIEGTMRTSVVLLVSLILAAGCGGGKNGTDGTDGTSCTVTDNGDGTITISCDDGTSVTVADGDPGTSCTVVDNGDGTKTITCEDGTTVTVSDGTNPVDTGTVVVTVTDEEGTLIDGADVETDPAGGAAATDSTGTATLADLPVGIYNVWARMDGYRSDMIPYISIVAGATINITLVLGEGVEWNLIHVEGISGARGDTDPLPGTEVRLTRTSSVDNKIISNGLRNVAIGNFVYVTGADASEAGDAVTAWAWTLLGPAGSSAVLQFDASGDATSTTSPRTFGSTSQTQFARFRPNVPGIYKVTLEVTTSAGTETSSIDVYAGTYLGQASCASCHANPAVVGENKAVFADFMLTGHATKFQGTFASYSSSSDSCLPCHNTGYDESSPAGGFDDMMRASGWDPSTGQSVGGYVDATYGNDISAFLADTMTLPAQNVMNIQCEACHGPGSNHPPAESHMSWWPGNCKQCHPQPNQWALSAHSIRPEEHMAGSTDCARCHTGQGFVVGFDHGEELVFPNDVVPGMQANMFEPGNSQPVGCAACHDPHKFTHPFDAGTTTPNIKSHQLRFVGEVESPMGFTSEAEYAAGCFKCHSNKRDAAYLASYLAGGESRGPHHNGQADVLMGEGGAEYTGETYGTSFHTSIEEKCVTCHMSTGSGAVACTSSSTCAPYEVCYHSFCTADKMGGHTFSMTWTDPATSTDYEFVDSCNTSGCHTGLTTFDRQPPGATGDGWDCDSTTTGIQDEVANMLDDLEACLIAANSFLDDGTGALKSSDFDDSSVTEGQRRAIWNLILVRDDGSLGVHNPKYAMQLLRDAYDDLACTPALSCARP